MPHQCVEVMSANSFAQPVDQEKSYQTFHCKQIHHQYVDPLGHCYLFKKKNTGNKYTSVFHRVIKRYCVSPSFQILDDPSLNDLSH